MKIVIIQPRVSYYVGGSEKVALKHAEVLSKFDGNKIILYTIKPIDNKYSFVYQEFLEKNPDIKIEEIEIPLKYHFIYDEEPELNQSRWDRETILFSILVHNKIKTHNASIVLSYYLVDSVFRNLDIPNAVYLGGYPREEIEIYNAFLSFCDATISNSKNVQKMWEEKLKKNRVSLNYIVPKGSEKPNNLRKIFTEGIHVVFAGRLIHGKGVENLIASFKKVLSVFPGAHLSILGDGPEKEKLIEQTKTLGINKNITFYGFVNNAQDYFYSSTICVFPSVYKEGLMTVVAEALSVGACVITSSNMGSEELIENGENGVLVAPGNIEILTETILELLKNNLKREELKRNATEYALKNLSWDNVGEKLNGILSEIVELTEQQNIDRQSELLPNKNAGS